MILRYYGHSLFTLTLADGTVIATDPYGTFYDYPRRTLKADVCTVSHAHHDHNALEMITGKPQVIDREGDFHLHGGLRITGIQSFHDEKQGALRGTNLMFVYQTEGLRIAHLGDLGCPLTSAQAAALGSLDVLLLPVGGYYTIDAEQAAQTVELLQPRIVIPMHYRTAYNQAMPVATEEPFLQRMQAQPEPMTVCRLTMEDISERPPVMLMRMTEA